MVACYSQTCLDSGTRCSWEDDELFDRICYWRRVKRTHFDEIAKTLPIPPHRHKALERDGTTTKLLTPCYKEIEGKEDLEEDSGEEREEDEDEESIFSDDDSGSQSEEDSVHTVTDDDDDEEVVEACPKVPSKRKRADSESDYEQKPLSKKQLQGEIIASHLFLC